MAKVITTIQYEFEQEQYRNEVHSCTLGRKALNKAQLERIPHSLLDTLCLYNEGNRALETRGYEDLPSFSAEQNRALQALLRIEGNFLLYPTTRPAQLATA